RSRAGPSEHHTLKYICQRIRLPPTWNRLGSGRQFVAPRPPASPGQTVIVNRGGPLPGRGNPKRMMVRNDSAGLGIPRGSVRNLANVSQQVKQNGFAETRLHNSIGSSISGMSPGVRSGPGATPMGHGTSPRMSAPHSVAPAHSALTPHASTEPPHFRLSKVANDFG